MAPTEGMVAKPERRYGTAAAVPPVTWHNIPCQINLIRSTQCEKITQRTVTLLVVQRTKENNWPSTFESQKTLKHELGVTQGHWQ